MWCKSFFISFLIHLIIILLLFFIPVKTNRVSDCITVDFTTLTISSGGGKFDKIKTSNGGNNAGSKSGKEQKKHTKQQRNMIVEAMYTEKLPEHAFEKNEVSLNPIIENKNSIHDIKNESNIKDGNFGSSGNGYGESYKGTGYGGLGIEGGGKGVTGVGYGGINISDYAYLREIIMKNIIYPEKARRMGWEGKVVLSFVINETGIINDVKILKSSGYPVLDEAAREALFKVNKFQKKHERLFVQLPIEFRLR